MKKVAQVINISSTIKGVRMNMAGEPKAIKSISIDRDLLNVLLKEAGHESLSSYINRTLRQVHGMPEA